MRIRYIERSLLRSGGDGPSLWVYWAVVLVELSFHSSGFLFFWSLSYDDFSAMYASYTYTRLLHVLYVLRSLRDLQNSFSIPPAECRSINYRADPGSFTRCTVDIQGTKDEGVAKGAVKLAGRGVRRGATANQRERLKDRIIVVRRHHRERLEGME